MQSFSVQNEPLTFVSNTVLMSTAIRCRERLAFWNQNPNTPLRRFITLPQHVEAES